MMRRLVKSTMMNIMRRRSRVGYEGCMFTKCPLFYCSLHLFGEISQNRCRRIMKIHL
jgi:hypothetical protein